jgi:phosphoglycerate dehydrogenase-like enzyme
MTTLTLLDPIAPVRHARFTALLPDGFTLDVAASHDEADRLAAITGARFAVSGHAPVTAEMIRAGAAAGLVAIHKWGVGYDNIDIEAARAAGVRVLRTTGSNAVPVAETTLGMILALQRGTLRAHTALTGGTWAASEIGPQCLMLSGKTVGLVGFGPIARTMARLLTVFRARVLYTKPVPVPEEEAAALGVTWVPFAEMLREADILSLHCPLTPQTRGLIDAAALAAMKPGGLLINTARGGLVDEAAVAAALRSGHLRGAGFDVFSQEPAPADHPLIGLPNVIVSPHIAAQAADNFAPTVSRIIENCARMAAGLDPAPGDVVV